MVVKTDRPEDRCRLGTAGCLGGDEDMFRRRRLADVLPVFVLLCFFIAAVIGGLVWSSEGLIAMIPALGLFLLTGFFLCTSVGSRWYWGGVGCRECGRFSMNR